MQNNTYYNDSLSNDESEDSDYKAQQIALRIEQLHEIFLHNNPTELVSLHQFLGWFINLEVRFGSKDAALSMLEKMAAPQQPAPVPASAPEPDNPISQSTLEFTAPYDVKLLLCQRRLIAAHGGLSLEDRLQADRVTGIMVEKFESSMGGMQLLQSNGLPLYTGSFTYTYEN